MSDDAAAADARVLAVVDELVAGRTDVDREQALRKLQRQAQERASLRVLLAERQRELDTALGLLRWLAANDRHVAGLIGQLTDRAENYVLDQVLPDVWPTGSLADSAQAVADQVLDDLAEAPRPPGAPPYAAVPSRTTQSAREAQEEYVRQLVLGGADEQTLKRLVRPLPVEGDPEHERDEES